MRHVIASRFLCFIGWQALPAQMNKLSFVEYTLDNGLHVILHQDKSTPIVAVSVMYHVGSKNENPERTGFAHFFEHLMFEGSENVGRGEFDKYIQKAGGTLNANTTYDRTYYFEILPSNQLALGLWLESERMMHARVDETGIETQREVAGGKGCVLAKPAGQTDVGVFTHDAHIRVAEISGHAGTDCDGQARFDELRRLLNVDFDKRADVFR